MEQLSAYEDGEQSAPQAILESGQDTTSGMSVSSHPDLSQDGDLVPLTSVPAGPTEPVTCQQDLPSPASLPVMAGSKDPPGVLPVPPPPDEPYDSFLIRMGRNKKDSTSSVPQPAAAVPLQELVTLPTTLPQPFPTFEGPVLAPRAPSSTPRTRMPLPGHCYVPPHSLGRGPDRVLPFRTSTCICTSRFLLLQALELPRTPSSSSSSASADDSFDGSETPSSYPLPPPIGWISCQAWRQDFPFPFHLHLLPQRLPLGLQHPSLPSRPLRPPQLQWLLLQTCRQWCKTGKTPSSRDDAGQMADVHG